MKLIYCTHCDDIVKLTHEPRTCECGRSGGRYFSDGLNAEIWGDAVPLGIANPSFAEALKNRPKSGHQGSRFEAFVIPEECSTVIKGKP